MGSPQVGLFLILREIILKEVVLLADTRNHEGLNCLSDRFIDLGMIANAQMLSQQEKTIKIAGTSIEKLILNFF
jgi:hypothetical protein